LTPASPTPALADPALPAQIGKYRVLRKLGEGATSEVFLARDDFHGREVAIKRVRADAAQREGADSRYYERFFAAEAALVGRLQHPNVVQIYDAVADPALKFNTHFITIRGATGRIDIKFESVPMPDNPKTGVLTALTMADDLMKITRASDW